MQSVYSLIYLECIIYRLRLWNSIHALRARLFLWARHRRVVPISWLSIFYPHVIFRNKRCVFMVFFSLSRSSGGKFDNVHVNFVEEMRILFSWHGMYATRWLVRSRGRALHFGSEIFLFWLVDRTRWMNYGFLMHHHAEPIKFYHL